MMAGREILYCHCAHADVVPAGTKREVLRALCAGGVSFDALPDLCGRAAAAHAGALAAELAAYGRIAACYPRAVRWLLHYAGAARGDVQVVNMRETGGGEAAAALGIEAAGLSETDASAERAAEIASLLERGHAVRVRPDGVEVGPAAGPWVPWFPVIDRDRCTDCLKCLNFCLFGVYRKSAAGSIEVAQPANCKTHCPACARVCPSAAIMFPKYKPGPLSGGPFDASEGVPVSVDIGALMKKDLRAALRARGRFSTAADEETAADERCPCSCLEKVVQALDVPADVLAALGKLHPAPPEPEEPCA